MKIRVLFIFFCVFCVNLLSAQQVVSVSDSLKLDTAVYDVDSLLESKPDTVKTEKIITHKESDKLVVDTPHIAVEVYDVKKIMQQMVVNKLDSNLLQANPLFVPLVLKTRTETLGKVPMLSYKEILFRKKPFDITNPLRKKTDVALTQDQIVDETRKLVADKLEVQDPFLFKIRQCDLPPLDDIRPNIKNGPSISSVRFVDDYSIKNEYNKKPIVQKVKVSPWTKKALAQFQFSQNLASDNWYQGGSSTMSVLGILTAKLNYDDKKNIQWENNGEWRMGFYSVFNDSTALRTINTNEDAFKINSKLGIKAGGNWYYSGSVDFSTQFLNNYKAVNSTVLKSTFLTPVRLNIGVGLDYKYKKLLSVMLAPVAYKYIYANDITNLSPTLFGIPEGDHVLSQIGSSFKTQLSYSPVREIQIDSKFSFYTNYEQVEIDWEIVTNFTINRFLSTRLSLNPRYDNTVILPSNEKAQLQFKELLSFGLTYKLID